MKSPAIAFLLAAGLAIAACGGDEAPGETRRDIAGGATLADGKPLLRDGLWRTTNTTGGHTIEATLCVDRAFQERMNMFGGEMAGEMCSENSVTPRPGGGWTIRSICEMPQVGRIVTDGATTGDMRTAYRTELTSVTTGSSMAALNGTTTTVIEGRHEGACPAGVVPGDMTGPNGERMSLGGARAVDGG